MIEQEGVAGLYREFSAQVLKTSLKQIWCWPMMTGIPMCLSSHGLGDMSGQMITGLSIATVDAAITTPLEKIKILSASNIKRSFSLTDIYKEGWKGLGVYWAKKSVTMVTFLTSQKYLREVNRSNAEQPLSFFEMLKVGAQVSLIVSVISAPFDSFNTLKQSQNVSLFHFALRSGALKLYRGLPLNVLSLVIQNVASVAVLEKMGK